MRNLTSNEYYGGLNRRFEKRANLLRKLGWKYERLEKYNCAVFVRNSYHKGRTIAAGTVMNADRRVWNDTLARELNH